MSNQAPAEQYGLIISEPIDRYHASQSCSHSKLEVLRDPDRGAARYLGTYITKNIPPFAGSDATDFGQAFDSMLLENTIVHISEPETYMGPESQKKDAPLIEKPWNNNAGICKEWHAQNAGKIVLTTGQIRLLEAMKLAVLNNPDAAALLTPALTATPEQMGNSGGMAQITFRAKFKWFAVQCRPDMWHPQGVDLSTGKIEGPVIADLKTAEDQDQFDKNRRNFGYDRQAALYRRVVREILADIAGVSINEIQPPEFYFVVVFKSAPVDSIVFKLGHEDMELADEENMSDLKYLHSCYEKGEWPGSLRGVQTLPPLWRKIKKDLF